MTDGCPTRAAHLVLLLALALVTYLSPLRVSAQEATPDPRTVATPFSAPLPPPWLEFGPNGQLIARALVEGQCPMIALDGLESSMDRRAAPTSAFPVVACEATIPFGVQAASILGRPLPLPQGPIKRIAVIGDTGCRLNDWEKSYQSCNDPQGWPFAQVAASVAAWQPDLIVHVGDYLYRESPCPPSGFDCAGSPHGDNWPTWNADFFAPAAPLLGVAPWIFMRGNHETCDRNPGGWFAYLDTRPYQATCQVFTEPYVIDLQGPTFAALDSAEASDETVKPGEAEEYAREFATLTDLAPTGSWLVTHRPVWGILQSDHKDTQVANAAYEAATGDAFHGQYAMILSGHIHLAEAIAFDVKADRPPQIIAGNSGTALDNVPTGSPTAGELGDAEVEEAETLDAFGFLTLEPSADGWVATQRDAMGQPSLTCLLDLPQMQCAPPS